MRNINLLLGVLLVLFTVAAYQQSKAIDAPSIAVTEFTATGGQALKDAVKSSLDSLETAVNALIASDVTVTAAITPQADTNATTTTTGYTPDAIGQVLIGGAGEGTNAVWIAKGVTTNDWVQVAP